MVGDLSFQKGKYYIDKRPCAKLAWNYKWQKGKMSKDRTGNINKGHPLFEKVFLFLFLFF